METRSTVFKKKLILWRPFFWLVLVITWVVALQIRETHNFLSYLFCLVSVIHFLQSTYQYVYIPLFGKLIVCDQGVRLNAGIFSWFYKWESIDTAYKQEGGIFYPGSLLLTQKQKVKKTILGTNYWFSISDQNKNFYAVLESFITIKSESERLSLQQQKRFKDLDVAVQAVSISLIFLYVLAIILSTFIHPYYAPGRGTSLIFYVICGSLFGGVVPWFLFKKRALEREGVLLSILAAVIGIFLAPIILKAYTIVNNDVEVHSFKLVKKNGGYQHWKSLNNEKLEFKLGSVNNVIHTGNEQGAIIKLKLIEGRFLTLYLPDEIEKTRYRINMINE